MKNKNKNMKEQPEIKQVNKERKEEVEKKYNHVKLAIDESSAEEKDYGPHQAKTWTIPIEAFGKLYSNETERLKRIDELAEIYKTEFAKQEADPKNKGIVYCSRKAMDHIFKSVLTEAEKQELENSCKAEETRQLTGQKESIKVTWKQPPETVLLRLLEKVNSAREKLTQEEKSRKKSEKPFSAEVAEGQKRPHHEIELEQRPQPLEGEAFDVWLKRIGGPNVELLESLDKYQAPKKKGEAPLRINKNGTFKLNSENVSTYFNKEKLDEKLAEKDPNISYIKKRGEYRLKKGLFQKPAVYLHAIVEELKRKQKIVADKRFGKSVEKWTEELEARGKEKPKEEPKKQKTIAELEEEMERLQTAYAPLGWFRKKPVVRDLGYYVNQNKIEEIKKEIEKLKTGKPTSADAKEEKVEEKKEKEETKKSGAVGSAVGGGIRMGESAEDIENRLQELSAEISTSSVLGRSKLEKEQKKLRKRLKKLKRRS